ncbi:hypothetical protein Tco_0149426 [Tanacetum coccineum]
MSLGTPVISSGVQANTSKLRWSRSHSLAQALSVRLEPIITVYSACSGLMATLILSSFTLVTGGGWYSGSETIAHSMGMILLLLSVSVPPITGNFIIPCVVDGTAFIFRNPGLPMIPLYGEVDLTTMKSIHVDVECSSSPTFTKSVICPNGHFILPLNPISKVVAGTI